MSMSVSSEPTGLKASSGIELLTWATPNGYKANIILEELKEAYGLEYTWQGINISKNTQKEPWFTKINPNGRIPAIVDHDHNELAVFEGIAILGYLTRRYDPERRFSFDPASDEYTEAEAWMAWHHGGVGPMQGQAGHFVLYAPEKIAYAAQRYVGEAERLYGILDKRLEGRDYVAGAGRGRYSIADIAMVGWAQSTVNTGIAAERFPNVNAWLERVLARPTVQRAMSYPSRSALSNAALKKRLEDGDEALAATLEARTKFVQEAQEKYHYKYASP